MDDKNLEITAIRTHNFMKGVDLGGEFCIFNYKIYTYQNSCNYYLDSVTK